MTVHDINLFNGETTSMPKILHYKDVLELSSRVTTETQARNLYAAAIAKGDNILATHLTGITGPLGWNLNLPITQAGKEATRGRQLLVDLMNLATIAPSRMTAAEMYTDPRFTHDALTVARNRYVRQAREEITAEAESILTQLTALADKANTRAATVTPTLNPDDAVQLARTAQAWQFNILPQLDINPNWNNIMAGLDIDGLLAIQRFAPAWIKTNSGPTTNIAAAISIVLDGVEDTLPDAVSDPTARDLLTNADDINEYLNNAKALAPQLTTMKRSDDLGITGISVQNIAYSIGALGELTPVPTKYNGY